VAAGVEPLVVWINGAVGIGETLAIRSDLGERAPMIDAHRDVIFLLRAGKGLVRELVEDVWTERVPRTLLDAGRAERGEAV
jgi:hypothetical protein